ncbi:MAG: hypothetical protein M1830_000045 [Pleopsidium flavum]|nr:MAG: hypothetical protein M1830_000045 [Pleopsidium flavum]
MSIDSIVDHTTPSGFVSRSMDTFNDPSLLVGPVGPYGFPPDLVYGASTSDDSPFYSSDSCYSPNPEYPRAQIANQSYHPMHQRQRSSSITSLVDPYFQPQMMKSPLCTTSTLPAWQEIGTNLPPQELIGANHFEGDFLQPVDTSNLIPLSELDGYEWTALRGVLSTPAGLTLDKHGMVGTSAGSLEDYLDCYWQHFHPLFPIIHRPTLFIKTPPPLLAAAMVAIGAQFSTRPGSNSYSTFMHEACIKLLSTQRNQITDRSRISDLQTILLLEVFSKYRSRRADVQMSSRFKVLYSSLLEDRNRLLADPTIPLGNIPKHANQQVLQAAWHCWIDCETRRRILLSAFMLDTKQVTFFQQRSSNRHVTTEELDLPFPCGDLLWESRTVAEWRLGSESEQTYRLTEAADIASISDISLNPFQSTLILCHLVSSQTSATEFDNDLQTSQNCLPNSTAGSSNCGLLTYHALLMAKKTPIRALLTVSGESWIFGHKLSEEADFHAAKTNLRVWATTTNDACQAVWHATTLLRHAMHDDNTSTNMLHEQWSIYLAALVCWAFGFVAQPCVDPLTALWGFATISVEDQEMWTYLSDMDKPSWEFMPDAPMRWRTVGLLECVRRRIDAQMGGLLNEAQSVLKRLVEGVSTLSQF